MKGISFHMEVVRFANFSCAMRVMALLTVEEKIQRYAFASCLSIKA
jgi:hypothetical protein